MGSKVLRTRVEAPVLEVFASIQGEGAHVGRPQVLVRLAGCPLRCRWCDTPGSWELRGDPHARIAVRDDAARREPGWATPFQVACWVAEVEPGAPRPVSVTGGEPLAWPGFVLGLRDVLGTRPLQLETAGGHPRALERVLDALDHVSLDLKLPADLDPPVPLTAPAAGGPGELDEDVCDRRPDPERPPRDAAEWREARRACLELVARRGRDGDAAAKIVVAGGRRAADYAELLDDLQRLAPAIPLYLQPVTPVNGVAAPSPALLEELVEAARELDLDVRVVPQVHRALGLAYMARGTTQTTGLARVALIGRPNVGKSTLLNRMCGSRVSIVEPTSGVTRDRVQVPARLKLEEGERWFEVVDTGGIGIVDRDDLSAHVEEQVATALAASDLILFLVDARDGPTPLDAEVARRLRGIPVPVLLVANKTEGRTQEWGTDEFRRLGVGEGPFAISAQNGVGLTVVYERIGELVPLREAEGPYARGDVAEAPVMKLAVIGQRNSGKSTLINHWAGEERMIVSEIPGTTRDAVDVRFERAGRSFVAIDTAGVRKRKKLADAIEFFSDARSYKTIRRADVVLLLFDVSRELSVIDKKLARYVIDHHKPVFLGGNKWDLVTEYERSEFVKYVRAELLGMSFAPLVFLSAKSGQGTDRVLETAERLWESSRQRVGTGELNRVLDRATSGRGPTSSASRVKILYATQAESTPPTFVLFVNDKRLIGKSYLRYLENRLREELPFKEVPLRIVLRDRSENPEDAR